MPRNQDELAVGLPDAIGSRAQRVMDQPMEVKAGAALAEPLLTANDVAQLLRVPRSSVYEYARRLHEPLPSLRIGRHRRFDRGSVERWLARQRGR